MRKLSLRARKNPATARLIIVVSFILLTILAIFSGELMRRDGISIPQYCLGIVVGIYLLADDFPNKFTSGKLALKWTYNNKRFQDGLLACRPPDAAYLLNNDLHIPSSGSAGATLQ